MSEPSELEPGEDSGDAPWDETGELVLYEQWKAEHEARVRTERAWRAALRREFRWRTVAIGEFALILSIALVFLIATIPWRS